MTNTLNGQGTKNSDIRELYNGEIPALLDSFPSDCFHHEEFFQEGGLWRCILKCNFPNGKFYASTVHRSPKEAFEVVRKKILRQVQEWRVSRFNLEQGANHFTDAKIPRILLIDDDEDFLLGTVMAFEKAGCHTDVSVKYQELHRKIANNEYDYIFLDWRLNEGITANQVLERAGRLITTFSDLREKFNDHKPRLVTYSALERDQIQLPDTANSYFEYLGHWQKPMPFTEVVSRIKKWL